MAPTARDAPASEPPPWHRRYRLLLQIGGLALFGGIVAVVAVILVDSSHDARNRILENVRLREELAPLMGSVVVRPADLPEAGWVEVPAGLGIQGNLRRMNLGAATVLAEGVVGAANGFSDAVRVLSSGIIVADTPAQAQAAFERLRAASDEEALEYLEPAATNLIAVVQPPLSGPRADRFGVVVAFERGTREGDRASLQLAVTVLFAVSDRALLYVALNDFYSSPPAPHPVDLEAWLDDLTASYLAAERELAAGGDGSS